MSLRKKRKRGPAQTVAALWVGSKAAKVGSKAVKGGSKAVTKTGARAGSNAAKKASGKRSLALLGAALGLAVVAAARRRRRGPSEEPYGPPNESVPSHETLAPAQEAAASG